ncbi:hypothetical protein VCR1J2_20094 [Vibrio coralliirubri]|nr:hypothetical protein VCR1J2_20094 [Vibrio coralliirubri]
MGKSIPEQNQSFCIETYLSISAVNRPSSDVPNLELQPP